MLNPPGGHRGGRSSAARVPSPRAPSRRSPSRASVHRLFGAALCIGQANRVTSDFRAVAGRRSLDRRGGSGRTPRKTGS